MEEEAEKLKEMQNEVEKQMNLTSPTATGGPPAHVSMEDKVETDTRSVYVGNVSVIVFIKQSCTDCNVVMVHFTCTCRSDMT